MAKARLKAMHDLAVRTATGGKPIVGLGTHARIAKREAIAEMLLNAQALVVSIITVVMCTNAAVMSISAVVMRTSAVVMSITAVVM